MQSLQFQINTNVTQLVCEWLLFLLVFHIKSPLFNCDPDAEKTTSPASWGQSSSRAVTGRPAASSRGQCSAVQGGSRFLHCYTVTLLHYTLVTLLITHTVISDWQQWASLQVLSSSPSQDSFWTRIGRSGAKLSSSKQWAWSKCERESNSMLILSDRGKAN